MNKKQVAVSVAVVAVVGYLYWLPVKPLADLKPNEQKGTGTVAKTQQTNTSVTVDMVSASAKTLIAPGLADKITALEGKLKTSDEAGKLSLQKQLAQAWDDVNKPAPAAFYYQAIARQENTAASWIAAGDHFNDAYKLTQDTLAQPVFDANAVEDFQNAIKLKPESLDAKTGLGIAYVNGGGTPMQGIALLLDVVSKEPNNINANMNLGLFSMKSGQFDKAVTRFKIVIAQKPEVEPYFYLAESYRQLGMKKEAIDAYEQCKQMMPDPAFDEKIDGYINELKK
jgi:tetratricopeptide (TPR) repeat protein